MAAFLSLGQIAQRDIEVMQDSNRFASDEKRGESVQLL
jgi:hypothetical protein